MSYVPRHFWRPLFVALVLLLLPACSDRLVAPPEQVTPVDSGIVPIGAVEITITVDGDNVRAVASDLDGPSFALTRPTVGDGTIQLEAVSSGSFIEGTRAAPAADGQRYFTATFRVRNAQSNGTPYATPRTNLTFFGARRANSIGQTAISVVRKFDGTAANSAIAAQITPSGAVVLDDSLKMKANIPDVLQIITEAEAAAAPRPADILEVFPWGFVVRNPSTPNSRTLPANPGPDQFDGVVTFGFRVPLQPAGVAEDAYNVTFAFLAVDDSETRVTESIEEQDTASSRRLRARATALGATTTTILNGSPAADPFVTDYPGQRQICSPRVAGTAASPTRTINADGAYVRIGQYYPGEVVDACAPYFRSGTPARPSVGVNFPITVRAMDRYGNVRTTAADVVALTTTDAGATVITPPVTLASGAGTIDVRYAGYNNFINVARGRRNSGAHVVPVAGATRTWTGSTSNSWFTESNWNPAGAAPGVQDTIIVPGDRPNYPLLVQNITIGGVTMVNGASVQPFINLSSFDFTLNSSLELATNGTLTGTGRLILAGSSKTVGGGLSNVDMRNMRVTGTYSATSNLNVTGGRIVVQGGRLRSQGFRVRVRPS